MPRLCGVCPGRPQDGPAPCFSTYGFQSPRAFAGLAPLIVKEVFRIVAQMRHEGISLLLVERNAHLSLAIAEARAQELAGASATD